MRAALIFALLGASSAHLMESLKDIPDGWKKVGKPSPDEKLFLRISMNSPGQGLFEQKLYEVSDPKSPSYAQYLKRDEIKEILRPTSEATAGVIKWLLSSGVSRNAIADDGEWINFVTPVDIAEKLLDTSFALFKDRRGSTRVRTLQYSVPEPLHPYIDMIQPTTRFGEMQSQASLVHAVKTLGQAPYYKQKELEKMADFTQGPLSVCDGETTIAACVRALYKLPDPEILHAQLDNRSCGFMAFANFLEQVPRYADLKTFQREYTPFSLGQSFSWESIAGANNDQNSPAESDEANLDVEYLQTTGWPVPMHAYNTAGRAPFVPDLDTPTEKYNNNEPYLDFLNYVLARPDHELPHTLAVSYGENEQGVPEQYRKTVCNMLGQLGARGVSVIFASGDLGVTSACLANDGSNRERFLPVFPAACPFVTSVGATTGHAPERAIGISSGGFSDTWARPAYQDQAVTSYLRSIGDLWKGLYNPQGRAFPDVAAQGMSLHVIDRGQEKLIDGTSLAAPIFAGVISLLNAQRIQNGHKPLGFLNPWIYSSGYQGLNDIVVGGSVGCDGTDYFTNGPTPNIPGAGWNATKGWDPVSGFGSPNYPKLYQLAMEAHGTQGMGTVPKGFRPAPDQRSKRAWVA
ncbi:Tripeptidyl-peptidase sed2 [Lecanosticta acicola]|uniref:tripeptidyl-peptidase II n=1 Tax=Lecanosticta acicola TaxID=111012 RepID=A0AAI8YWI7_9PEZI|nr:Tripeptidyl-peptidase sed2 [Lecanosticta acicola]